MKILHVWDQAGVACILAKQHRREGHDVAILKRVGYDPFGIFDFYGEPLMDLDGKAFLDIAINNAEKFDIVHVHSLYKLVPALRKKYRGKRLVLHYHGSEARNTNDHKRSEAEQAADLVLTSTADLMQHVRASAEYVPNPVDIDHFRPFNTDRAQTARRAFTFKTNGADIDWVLRYLDENAIDLDLCVIDRQSSPIKYSEMPRVASNYAVYVDLKNIGGSLLQAPSKTALECLACGLKVLNYKLEYLEELPKEHKPETVAARVLQMYDVLCR